MEEVADWTGEPGVASAAPTPAAGGRPRRRRCGRAGRGDVRYLLWAVLTSAYARLGFDVLGDDGFRGFRAMVLARIVEPTSKAEVVRVLDEIGAPAVSLRTLFRSLARSQAVTTAGNWPRPPGRTRSARAAPPPWCSTT